MCKGVKPEAGAEVGGPGRVWGPLWAGPPRSTVTGRWEAGGEGPVHPSRGFLGSGAGARLALPWKGRFSANPRQSLKFHGLPLSGGPLALTSSLVRATLRGVSRWQPRRLQDVREMSCHPAAGGQVGGAPALPALPGWAAIRLNSLPNGALLTQLLSAWCVFSPGLHCRNSGLCLQG